MQIQYEENDSRNPARDDPRSGIEEVCKRLIDRDNIHELKLVCDHLNDIQQGLAHRAYLLAIGQATLRRKQ